LELEAGIKRFRHQGVKLVLLDRVIHPAFTSLETL
jgi:hypothetical protein